MINVHLSNIKTLYHDRIDVSEGIDLNKRIVSKECHICWYCYFLDKGSKFQLSVCNGCHDISMMSMTLNNIAILNICDVDYCFVINGISNISN